MLRRYLRTESNRPVGLVSVDTRSEPNSIRFGFSRCAENDNFSKRIARQISDGRLRSGKYSIDRDNLNEQSVVSVLQQYHAREGDGSLGCADMACFIFDTIEWALREDERNNS